MWALRYFFSFKYLHFISQTIICLRSLNKENAFSCTITEYEIESCEHFVTVDSFPVELEILPFDV